MLTRVSNIEVYRDWMHWSPLFDGQEEPTIEQIVDFIVKDEPTEQMKVGTAFHKAIETAQEGVHHEFAANGYVFQLPDAELEMPAIRELRAYHRYGDLTVTGKVDGLDGKIVMDHKTTGRVDLERYLEGCQYKFYLDIFDADVFQWNIFQIKEVGHKTFQVAAPQVLRAYRYPGMADDCRNLAAEYYEFAKRYLNGFEPCLD